MEAFKLLKMTDAELVEFVISIEKERAHMDFTVPLFKHLKKIIEKESNVRILIKKGDSMEDVDFDDL